MPKNIQWIYGSYFNIQLIHMIHPRHTYNIVFENGWWGRLIHKILTKKTQKVGNSWNHENPYRGRGKSGVYTYHFNFTVHFLFSLQFFTRGRKKWGEGDSVYKHVNLRKSVCYDEKWVGVGGRPRPLMLRACILHVIQYVHEISLNEIKRSLSFYKMQNYIQRPTCRTFFCKSVLNYRCHSYAHSFSPHDQAVDLVCHPSLHM